MVTATTGSSVYQYRTHPTDGRILSPQTYDVDSMIPPLALLVASVVALLIGRQFRRRQTAHHIAPAAEGSAAVQAAVAGLVSLLLAFTLSGASQRFDMRRTLIVDEANAIGTAYLRLDLVPDEKRPALQEKFRVYLDSRIDVFRKVPDLAAVGKELARNQVLQQEIWDGSVAACKLNPTFSPCFFSLLAAENAMIDITTTRTMMSKLHPPPMIYIMLAVVVIASALYTGYAMAAATSLSWIHLTGFLLLNVFVFYVIQDLEHPRIGWLREDAFDQVLVELRQRLQ